MNRQYLNEDKYRRAKKRLIRLSVFVIAVGLFLILFGVSKILESNNMMIPQMGETDWFEFKTAQNDLNTMGIVLCMVGFFITVGIGGMLLLYAFSRDITTYSMQTVMPVTKEGMEEMAPVIGPVIGRVIKDVKSELNNSSNSGEQSGDTIFCKHCGSKIASDSKFCKICGKGQ